MYSPVTEDLDLFLEELGNLVNKYHYGISPFQIVLFTHDGIKTSGFVANEGGVIVPQYLVPEEGEE